MKNNYSTRLVFGISCIVMVLWLTGNGCGSNNTQSPPMLLQTSGSAQISVSSNQLTIGNVVLNNMIDQPVTIQNTGSAGLKIGQIAQGNPLVSPFSIVNDSCSGKTVASSAECSFKVRFRPTLQGDFNDDFDIPSNASNGKTVTVDVSGSGEALMVAIGQVKTDNCATGVLELIVTATDQNNTLLAGLTLDNFQLQENGVSQVIASLSPVLIPVPISVAMVLDYSGSMENVISTMETASNAFIGTMNADDEAAIIKFAVLSQMMQPFTKDEGLLTTAVDTEPSAIGEETHLYDALWFAIEQTTTRQQHKAIVLISDGGDGGLTGVPDHSVKTLAEVIAYATENAIPIYSIGLGDYLDPQTLNLLASETGGESYGITNADQLTGVYQVIRSILSGQYSLKYDSSLQGSSPIILDINVKVGDDEGTDAGKFAGCP